ncbi:hypothetical protein [Thalassospira sp. CH_XMU1458]|uniref:hypothetical protein n=1 Tax=Thalassospira sp. CH_XMU1458 TaxID=3107776 RepID=UPI00300D8E56
MRDSGILLLTSFVALVAGCIGYGLGDGLARYENVTSALVGPDRLQWEVMLTGLAAIIAGYMAIYAASTSQRRKETKEAIRFSGKVRRTIRGSIRGIENSIGRINESRFAPENLREIADLTREIAPEPNEFTPLELQLSYDQLDVMLNQTNGYSRHQFETEAEAINEARQLLTHLTGCLKDLDYRASKWYDKAFEEMHQKHGK